MELQKNMEREINIRDILWKLLFGWRQIICFGIIFSVLLGGIKYVKDSQEYMKTQNSNIESEEIELTVEEQEQVEDAKIMMERIENYQKYLNESALMQINPYEKPVVELQYYVKSDYTYNYTQDNQSDYSGDVMSLYYYYIKSGEMSDKVIREAELSVTQADFSELCSVSQSGNTMVICLTWAEEEKLDVISGFIKSELKQKEKEFQEVGSHSLKLLRESQNVVADTELADKKNTIANNIAYINTQLNSLKTNMSEQQLKQLKNEDELESDKDDIAVVKPGLNFKYMIFGAMFGIILICIWIVLKLLFSVQLQNPEEIRSLYNIRLLGEVTIPSKRKCILSLIDERLMEIKNRKKKKLSLEQQIKIVSANIVLSCQQNGMDCIYMTGSEYENLDLEILNMLKEELLVQGIQIKEGNSIFYDAESLKQCAETGNMLLVEQVGKSIYDEISNELNLAIEQKNNIIGIIVLV